MTHLKRHKLISSTQVRGYNTVLIISTAPELMKAEIYLHTKFRWDTSIYSWDKNTSGIGWCMAAIQEFYFQFPFWPTVYV